MASQFHPCRTIPCIDANTTAAFLDGALADAEARIVEGHLDGCSMCRRLFSDLVRSRSCEGGVRPGHEPGADLYGTRIGRYRIEAPLGRGAMGVVWAAYDEELDRRVALKMLRSDLGLRAADEPLQNRLLREAQALARLSHPNVVAVYDLLIHEGRLVIALELVEGMSLTSWLAMESHPWRRVLGAFVQAGNGLAAAHAVGLVHRDFKPDNVLCSAASRVAVTDFGLARLTGSPTLATIQANETLPMPTSAGLGCRAPNASMTRTGALVGTPRYMAPEQIQGRVADARSDQFSFCVALYEGLYRDHPFYDGREGGEALFDAVVNGRVREAPRRSKIPTWIRKVLLKGLSAAPEARHPSMDALLAALSADPRRRTRRTFGVFATAALLSLGVFFVRHRSLASSEPSCLDSSQKLAGIWDANEKAAVQRSFLASRDPRAAATWGAVEQALDKYAREWSVQRNQSCTAVRARRGLEPESIRRMACLDDRLTELRGLTGVFEHPDAEIMSNAIAASHALRPVRSCQDPSALDSTVKPPEPRIAVRVSELRQELAVVNALADTQKLKDAQTRAASLVENAHVAGYAPLEAEALLSHARVLKAVAEPDKVTPLLYRAAWLSDSSGDDKTRAVAWLRLLGYLGMNVGPKERPDLEIVRKQAIAAYERCRSHDGGGGADELEVEYLTALTEDALGPGKYEEARKRTTELVALSEKLYGDANWKYATALDSLAKTNLLLGDYQASLTQLERARGVLERASAVDTSLYAKVESATGKNLLALMRVTDAEAHFRHAIEIEERSGRPDNQRLVIPLYNLGMTLAEERKYDDAAAAYERSIALLERTTPRTDSRYWEMDIALAETELRQGKAQAALSRIETITKNQEAHDYFPVADFVLAETLFVLKRDPRRAHALASSALERFTRSDKRKGPRYEHRVAEIRAWLDQHPIGGRGPAA